MKLWTAWGMTRYEEAYKELQKVHDWLALTNEAAARSLDEGFEQTLTVNKAGIVLRASRCIWQYEHD